MSSKIVKLEKGEATKFLKSESLPERFELSTESVIAAGKGEGDKVSIKIKHGKRKRLIRVKVEAVFALNSWSGRSEDFMGFFGVRPVSLPLPLPTI
jgi:hypothetical protein